MSAISSLPPYDLRHAFVSLLLAEGRGVLDVAAQAGHAPSLSFDTYGHLMADLDGGEKRPAEDLIWKAREAGVRWVCDDGANDASEHASGNPRLRGFRKEPSCGLEPQTPSLPCKSEEGSEGSSVPFWVDNPWSRPL